MNTNQNSPANRGNFTRGDATALVYGEFVLVMVMVSV